MIGSLLFAAAPLALYSLLIFLGNGGEILHRLVLSMPLPGGRLQVSFGDVVVLVTAFTLFLSNMRMAFTSITAIVHHGMRLLVPIACMLAFLFVPAAGTSEFLIVTVAALFDVVLGFTIGVRMARRDLNIG